MSSKQHLDDSNHAHIVSLMYKLLTSSTENDDLYMSFDGDQNRRRDKLTSNKNLKGKSNLRIKLFDVFRFSESQEKVTYGLGDKVTLTNNEDEVGFDKTVGIADVELRYMISNCV